MHLFKISNNTDNVKSDFSKEVDISNYLFKQSQLHFSVLFLYFYSNSICYQRVKNDFKPVNTFVNSA